MFSISILSAATAGIASSATITLREGVSPTTGYTSVSTTIRADSPNNNYSTDTRAIAGRLTGANGALIRTVMSYSLADIPAGATIDSISLFVQGSTNDSPSTAVSFSLHELTTSFAGGTVTWNNSATGTVWGTAGGDFSTTVLSTINVTPSANVGVGYSFASSSDFVAAAQRVLNSGSELSLLMKLTDESVTGRQIFFQHSDVSSTTAARPALVINYTIPEPSAALLGITGAMGFFLRRRR
ncbi:MAG: DNRLRE domain-containing protein [Akkermansiaceae bacterium]|nr:DNRLRE domain-containing protein [Akkermansiaceae bacterium]